MISSYLRHSLLSLLLLCLVKFGQASDASDVETITLNGRLMFPDQVTPFNVTTRISVNHGEFYTSYSRAADGGFTVPNVPPGIYLIEAHSTTHMFSQVKCQYKPENVELGKYALSCIEYAYPGAPKLAQTESRLLVLTALATYEYFETKRGFSILSILKNPMVLIMLFSVGLMYYMPKMMEGLEPEEREQMKKQMEMQQNPTALLGELFSGFTGGEPQKEPKPHTGSRKRTGIK